MFLNLFVQLIGPLKASRFRAHSIRKGSPIIGMFFTWKRLKKIPLKSNLKSIEYMVVGLGFLTKIIPYTYRNLTLITRTRELRPRTQTKLAFFHKKVETVFIVAGRFKAKELFHCTPDTSRKLFQSKSTLRAQRIGR